MTQRRCAAGRASAPVLTYVTDTMRVPMETLLERIGKLQILPPTMRARVAIQLRDPDLVAAELVQVGDVLRNATSALGVRFLVNDRLDLAAALEADGVHLGRRSVSIADARAFLGEEALVSVACHDVDDVVDAARGGADMCTLSPIFESPGKDEPIGLRALVTACERLAETKLAIPIIALGGVTDDNFASCLRAGAAGVAAVRGEVDLHELVRMANRGTIRDA